MSRQVRIRVKKDTILSKKVAKKIKASYEEDTYKKNKKKRKGNDVKVKFKAPDKKKKKGKQDDFNFKGYDKKKKKSKSSKRSSNSLIVGGSERLVSNSNKEVAARLMKLLKKDMEIKMEMSKLVSKLSK